MRRIEYTLEKFQTKLKCEYKETVDGRKCGNEYRIMTQTDSYEMKIQQWKQLNGRKILASKTKPEKNSALNGNRTHDLCNAGVALCQLKHQL